MKTVSSKIIKKSSNHRRALSESERYAEEPVLITCQNNQQSRKRQLSDINDQTLVTKYVKGKNSWSKSVTTSESSVNETINKSKTGNLSCSLTQLSCPIPIFLSNFDKASTSDNCTNKSLIFSPYASLPELSFSSHQQQKRIRPYTLILTPNSNLSVTSSFDVSSIVQDKINLLTSKQLADYVKDDLRKLHYLIFDCRLPFRYHENHVKNSILFHVDDKISRQHLSTRGITTFLNTKIIDQCEVIILYDDTTYVVDDDTSNSCSNLKDQKYLFTQCNDKFTSSIPLHQLAPSMKCVYENIKYYNNKKLIYILNVSFNKFHEQYKSLCECSSSDERRPRSLPSSPTKNNYCEQIVIPLTAPLSANVNSFPMTKILNGLYIGNEQNAADTQLLSDEQITHIVNVTQHLPCYSSELNYYHLPVDDSNKQNLIDYFDKAYMFILNAIENNKKVLVHCQAGISRSPAIVIGFLMKYLNMCMNDAYDLVKQKRSIISPNFGFLGQLLEYEKKLKQYQINNAASI
ncbi:unnamed protein product [Didymodactylos carnosus]|uniref:Protein-serine/threonine phosphatase n=1 Tax=Didymodactylos carnosus TaxID=1234261 RepID=A0A815ATJ4_9BILA|nr:unnamed protein product [Didymodactylos carnosus]CAF1264128.1 unnamed protein product [Didymodactylos carnosus]CAF3971702.1 unnamed protein product [Didymodactylos carnosus]CAF4044797.1 unnamed protein product [Didymodactylos carnosus]